MKALESTKVFLLCKSQSEVEELSELAMLIPTTYRALKEEHQLTKELYADYEQEKEVKESKVVTYDRFLERKHIKTQEQIAQERSERLFNAIFED